MAPASESHVLGAQNPRIAELRRLIGRRSSRSAEIVIEGPRTVREALEAGHLPSTVIVPESGDGHPLLDELPGSVEIVVTRDKVFDRLAPSVSPQPMLALVPRPVSDVPAAFGADDVALVLTEVSDPGNVGTLIRVADAVGALIGTAVREGEPHDGGVLAGPVAIVLGSEPHGLDRDAVDVDAWVRIDMPGNTESLNVAMAGTLLAYEARRG
jgi:TrmH family RNA methyltransferase